MAKDPDKLLMELTGALTKALGDNLVTLALYGSTARGYHVHGRSDLNTLVILKDARGVALAPARDAIRDWVNKGEPAPLIFSEAEWRDSADVFAIEIEDMRDAHKILAGKNPFDAIKTTHADLRAQLERELTGKLLQLRARHAATGGNGKALTQLLEQSAGSFFVLFRALMRLEGKKPAADPTTLVQDVVNAAKLDQGPFNWVVGRLSGAKGANTLSADDPLAARYVDAIERLAKYVNDK